MLKDWIEVELGDVCGIYDNLRKPINSKERNNRIEGKNESELFPYYGATGQVGYIDGYLTDGEFVLIGEDGAPFFDYTKDVAYLIKGKTWVNNHAHILLSHFNNKFLLYYLNQFNFYGFVSGTTRLKLTQSSLKQIPVPIAPLPEQMAIAAKIEQLFSELDNGIANLKAAKSKLEIYRQAILKQAFEGKLTNPKNQIQDDLPKSWKWIQSGELFSFVTSGSRGWAKYYSDSGAIFVRITNLNFDTLELDLEDSKIQYVNPPANSEGMRTKIQEGDFLFSITGYLGMFAIAPKLDNAFVNQHISLCRPKSGFNKKFVGYWIIAKSGGNFYLNQSKKGAVKAGLNLDDLKNFPVPLAPIEEQNQIVQEIETRLSVCDKLNESIDQSLEKAQALRQSILKKAFEGKLLSQDELQNCRQQTDWEPAAKLLERVKNKKSK